MKRFIGLCMAVIMLVMSCPIVFAENDCSAKAEYAKTEEGYNVKGIYTCLQTSDVMMAILALYDENEELKSVEIKDINQNEISAAIENVTANDGDIVKAMLWRKSNMQPMAEVHKITVEGEKPVETSAPVVNPTTAVTYEPTTIPTTTPTTESTLSPTVIPTQAPTTVPTLSPTATPEGVTIWDFSEYSDDNVITATGNTTEIYTSGANEIEINIAADDSITENGLVWNAPSGTKADATTTVSNNRYIKFVAPYDGTMSITYKGSANASNKHPRIYVSCGEDLSCTTKDSNLSQLESNQSYDNNSTDFAVAEFKLTGGKTYFIWSYYYNSTSNVFTISNITFEKAPTVISTRNIYNSNMLLQRNQPIVIDGKCEAAQEVKVTLSKESDNSVVETVTAQITGNSIEKEWSATFGAVSDCSDTYKLTISAEGAENIEYTNILFGDLYLFTGQSNMWKQVSYYKNIDKAAYGTDAVAANATDKIRVMHTKGSGDYGSSELTYDAQGAQAWRDFSTYDNVSDISAPAYTAAVKMHKETGVPIGIITNAYPGSYISSWFPSSLAIDDCNLGKNGNSNERNWYNGRIYPLRNLKLSGIFWYQGCADASTKYHDNPYEYYSEMMTRLIDDWRELFGNDKLPFYYVQLSRIGSTIVDENNPDTGAAGKMPIKRAQTDVYLAMEDKTNVGLISTLDLYGNHDASGTANCRNDIHLGQKNIIGERMAAYALKDIYNKDVYSHGPMYKSSEVNEGKIIVTFDVSGKLKIMPSSQYTDTAGEAKIASGEINPDILNEFEVAGSDGIWHNATAEITADNQVTVSSAEVTNPVGVRYCGKDYPESPNLTDDSNLPSYVFEKTAETTDVPVVTTEPTATPTATPTAEPTATPTSTPTAEPTATPTATPTAEPTATPTATPTAEPSDTPEIVETYKFDFGGSTPADGYLAVTPDMVYDMSDTSGEFQYGFLGTTETSYADDVLPYEFDNRAIDGFSVVKGQYITLSSGGDESLADADNDYIAVPKKTAYEPQGASDYEGRYPIRFSMKADAKSYYTVTVTLTSSSDTEAAVASLFSEKRHIVAEDVTIEPGEKITFKFNVDIEEVVYKKYDVYFRDDMLNIAVTGENAAISSMIVEKHGKVEGTIKGTAQDGGVNDGVTLWVCSDSTGCDCPATVPFFALQNYAGVGQALRKYMPENVAVSNQGESGLASGDNAHFNRCMLKPGDYLYVEYGHNESGVDSYYENLAKYYTRAQESGAKLIIVSPINRHNNMSDGLWVSDFGGYIEKAEQFVKEKIDAGADDIAFVDMNTLYVAWMNTETARIREINSDLSADQAMSFYYRSVKGSSVDGTHMNDAGADQGAYYFFEAARDMVEAADGGSEDAYVLAQAEVVRPLIEGMKTTIGDTDIPNLPMQISDEIINAGTAPNTYWDTVASAAIDYKNSIAINSIGKTQNDDGSMTVSSVGIRLMNELTSPYAKAVVTVTSSDGVQTKYYTENNYDCTGDLPGTVKENSGFITSDKDHTQVTDEDKISEITVPSDAICTVQIVSCDDNWVVGDAPTPYSTVYEVEYEENTVFAQDNTSTDGWTYLGAVAEHSEIIETDDDGSYMSIHSSGTDSSGNKKNYAFYKSLDSEMSTGKYNLSFKLNYTAGVMRFALANQIGSASNPLANKMYINIFESGKAYAYSTDAGVVTSINDEGAEQSNITTDMWINVESIIDLDNGKLYVSTAGSDYAEFDIADWQQNTASTLPFKYFAIVGDSQGNATYGAVRDIKLTKVRQGGLEQRTVTASVNDVAYGSVTINDEAVSEKSVDISSSVTLKATANSGYKFVSWTDADGNVLAETAEYTISRLYTSVSVTANFEALADGAAVWDFSGYTGENAITAAAVENYSYNGLDIHINSADTITDSGILWSAPGSTKSDATVVSNNRYIAYTPETNGTISIIFSGNKYASSSKAPRLYLTPGEDASCMYKTNSANVAATATAKDSATTLTTEVVAGTTYYIWPYYYADSSVKFTVSNISFTPTQTEE